MIGIRQLLRMRCLLYIIGALLVALVLQWLIRFLLLKKEIRDLQSLSSQNVRLITFRLSHRWGIGNELFALASTYGIMRSYGEDATWSLCVDRRAKIFGSFQLDGLLSCRADAVIEYLNAGVHLEFAYGFFDPSFRNLDPDRHLVVGRFLQSWRYFNEFGDEIRRLFAFKESISTNARNLLTNAVESHFGCERCVDDIMKIGVHVRRSNMAENQELHNLGYVVADREYITRAFAFYDKKFSRRRKIFIVCSDSILWCKENLQDRSDVVFMDTGKAELDMAVLSICDNSIITVGTFGWWAAWLSNGTTVFYRNWPRKGSMLEQSTNHEDYFPSTWIGL